MRICSMLARIRVKKYLTQILIRSTGSKFAIVFDWNSTQQCFLLKFFFYCRIQFCSWYLFPAGDTGTFPFQSPALYHPQLRRGAPRHARRSGASRQAVPSPSAAAASPTSRHPVPPSASLAVPRNCAEREALAERYYACAFCDKGQGSGDGCRLWHLNVVALTFSSDP